MKISKIIFTSYFSILGLFLLSLMVLGYKYSDKEYPRKYQQDQLKSKNLSLESFSHLVIDPDCQVIIKVGDKPSLLDYRFDATKGAVDPDFKMQNDTLYLTSTNNCRYGVVITCNQLLTVIGKNCVITLDSMHVDNLMVDSNQSTITLNRKAHINSLKLNGINHSNINSWGSKVRKMNFYINSSNLNSHSMPRMEELEGQIINHSNVRLVQAKKMNVVTDETSVFNL